MIKYAYVHDATHYKHSPPVRRPNERQHTTRACTKCQKTSRSGQWTRRPERVVRTTGGAAAGGDAGTNEDGGTDEDAGSDEVGTAVLSICAGFSRSTEMVCGLPVDPMIVKNLGYRRWTLKGPSYGGWRGRRTASLRTKT